ncbi:MAG: TetR family transcriptional regulator [Gulosibacter sp.]|uniref:TetR family transcriptional regulator n=1 Tax=Gulosibacter sp. TaxID=2817531 RepID=UPI003F8E0023
MSATPEPFSRGRGRPPHSIGALLTREAILDRALEIAGAEGFAALTMNRLARDLTVTPKALYNHVRNRQDVIDGVAALIVQSLPTPEFDANDWQNSLRAAYRAGRKAYRKHPRATLISLDETVSPTEVDPGRILLAEDMLEFFVSVGLTLEQAVAVRGAFLTDLFGFVLMIDYRYDTSPAPIREALAQPVPAVWLEALPEVPAPLARQAAEQPALTSDAMFEEMVTLRILAIESLLAAQP